MDRDKLKEKIAKAIGDEEGFGIARYHEAEAALTAIEEAGYVVVPSSLSLNKRRVLEAMCQAKSSTQGETVLAPAEPLQADLVADAALMKALGSVAWLADQEHRKDHHESTLIAVGLLRELRDGYQRIAERRNKESGEAVDRGLPRHFSLHFCANGYGFLSIYSNDIPEFYISGSNDQAVTADIEPVLSRILWENYGTTIAGFCRQQAGSEIEEPERSAGDEVTAQHAEANLTHKINQDQDNG